MAISIPRTRWGSANSEATNHARDAATKPNPVIAIASFAPTMGRPVTLSGRISQLNAGPQ